ncbi:suppressor of cytokine signaling 4 [Anastrepha obliqua]|uniref:suppressor of cytokine signaling 4 n=1 Tax=Anastrepha obliqua TaxID=95512 RepID=UPI00240A2592|nr:suppressor of cytokine signaling 4 [Anastrepha obliqua]XP_054740434.1 suppressor of cytokine signaling 4 [Anastrepha obliqua]XP_054740435.1 suppressor of cytokine signaling 4 [Anastrepha obliqua]
MNERVPMKNEDCERMPSSGSGADAAATSNATTPTSATKEKRNWFQSLTRRKKSQSQMSLADIPSTSRESPLVQNNNNEPLQVICTRNPIRDLDANTNKESDIGGTIGRKRKDEKNVFQRLRKKMGLRFSSLRHRQEPADETDSGGGCAGGTINASDEFLTHSPIREPKLLFNFAQSKPVEEQEIVPFTNGYKRFIIKKWLQKEARPNHIMYTACSEMLSQVWYWGEISRLDAQKQLSDKPTGSFLVRDSETRGCQFTLSFRIVNVTFHYRLEYRDGYWHFEELQYESIVEMIEDILYRCTNDNFVCFVKVQNELQPPCPVILKYPLSRYFKMPQLQDLCRRVIQQHAASEQIAKLPIPPKLQEYLSIKRELVFHS